MSISGLKKQFNKANQYVSEKIGGVEGTKLDDDFTAIQDKTQIYANLVHDLQTKMLEILHPNPAVRMKISTYNAMSKVRGQSKSAKYPALESEFSEDLMKYSKDFDDSPIMGSVLKETSNVFSDLGLIKENLDSTVKQEVIDPLSQLETTEIKEVQHLLKKLESRRLDYDCKKRKHATIEELNVAKEKFSESKQQAEERMYNLLESEAEKISYIKTYVDAHVDYHSNTLKQFEKLQQFLDEQIQTAKSKPKQQYKPKSVNSMFDSSNDISSSLENGRLGVSSDYGTGASASPKLPSYQQAMTESVSRNSPINSIRNSAIEPQDPWALPGEQQPPGSLYPVVPMANTHSTPSAPSMPIRPQCRAIFDFVAEKPTELGFQANDVIYLTRRIDENWFEGTLNGKSGLFPVSYVEVTHNL